jgi:peptidoglycan/xylan/chitin deacetylase (PgdA/CDA1 family)
VVLSFDDGYRPQFTFALPQLRKHGWAGLLNLKAEGSDLYESNVRAMIAAGWEVAAHTIHHLDLTELDPAQLREEVAGSRAILRREYSVPVRNFCYPAGRYDDTVIAAVEAAGYVGATTEIPGYAERDAPYALARFEILGSTGVSGLAEDLRSG